VLIDQRQRWKLVAAHDAISGGEGSMTILLVEQFLDFCREIADDICIMDRGEIQHAGPANDLAPPKCAGI